MEKYEITKEEILEIVNKFPHTEERFKKLFPECFEKKVEYIKNFEVTSSPIKNEFMYIGHDNVNNPLLMGRCFILNNDKYLWEINMQSDGKLLLIPTLK